MLNEILNLEGVTVLDKKKQGLLNGGGNENCQKFTVTGSSNYPDGIYIECYNTEKEDYVVYNILAQEMDGCPEWD